MGEDGPIDLTADTDDESVEVEVEIDNDGNAGTGPQRRTPALRKQEAEEASPGPKGAPCASAGGAQSNGTSRGTSGTSGAPEATAGVEGDGSGGNGMACGGRSSDGGRDHVPMSTAEEEGRKTSSMPHPTPSGSGSKGESSDGDGQEDGLPSSLQDEAVLRQKLRGLWSIMAQEKDKERKGKLKQKIDMVEAEVQMLRDLHKKCSKGLGRIKALRDSMIREENKERKERLKRAIAAMEAEFQILRDHHRNNNVDEIARRQSNQDFDFMLAEDSDGVQEVAKGKSIADDDGNDPGSSSSSSEEEEEEEEGGCDKDGGSEASSSGYESEGEQEEEDPSSDLPSLLVNQLEGHRAPGHAGGSSRGADPQPEQERGASESPVEKRKSVHHEWIGREIMKRFGDGKLYKGTVDGYDPTQGKLGWWHVTYEDGDEEELGPMQVKKCLIPLQGAQVQKKAAGRKVPAAGEDRSKYLLCSDISGRKEKVPIPVFNEVNGSKELPDFTYVTEPVISDGLKEMMREAAACPDRLFLPIRTIRNGRGKRQMEEAKPKKATDCYDDAGRLRDWVLDWEYGITEEGQGPKVVSAGPKLPLEVFMTGTKGWGVRCSERIPCGTFICDYLGEILSNDEAEKKKGKDEYLFELNHFHCLYEEAVTKAEASGVPLDAATSRSWAHRCKASIEPPVVDGLTYGNVARFINDDCEAPNCVTVSVLTDKEMHSTVNYRIGIFASEDIEPFTELVYAYGYHFDDHVPAWQDPNQPVGGSTATPTEAPDSSARALEETADGLPGEAAPHRVSLKKRAAIETERGSMFRGVYKHKGTKKWACNFTFHGMVGHCGMHDSAPKAAQVRDIAAVLAMGPEAAKTLNFPLEDYAKQLKKFQRKGSSYGADLQKKNKEQMSDREAHLQTQNSIPPDVDHNGLLSSRKRRSSASTGVFWCQKTYMWKAQFYHKGDNINLGMHATQEKASAALQEGMRSRGSGAARKTSTEGTLGQNHLGKRKELDHAGIKANGATGSTKKKKMSSRYKGVSWDKKSRRWRAVIYDLLEKKNCELGYFDSEVEAAKAYDKAAVLQRGPKAEVNFPAGQPHATVQAANGVQVVPAGDELCDAGKTGDEPKGEQEGVRSSAAPSKGTGVSNTSGGNGSGGLSSGNGMSVPSNPSQLVEMDLGAVLTSVSAAREEGHHSMPTASLNANENIPNGGAAMGSPGGEQGEIMQRWYVDLYEEGETLKHKEFDNEEEATTAFDVMGDDRDETQTLKYTMPSTIITIEPRSLTREPGMLPRPESSGNAGLHWGEHIPEAFDLSLVGRKVRILWKGCGLWKDATVARWDQWKGQYAVEYQGSPPETEILELWNESVEWLYGTGGCGGGVSRVWQDEWEEDSGLGKGTRVCSDSKGRPRAGKVQGLLMASMRLGSERGECVEMPRYRVAFDDGGCSEFLTRKEVEVMMFQPHVLGTPRAAGTDNGGAAP